jgi:peroxiredoxin
MTRGTTWLAVAALSLAAANMGWAAATTGQAAPEFTAKDQDGREVDLAKLRGKVVVLEWTNPDCPFVQRHYRAKTMSTLADRFSGKDVVWLAVNSTNYMDAAKDRAWRSEQGFSYPILDDSAGTVGGAYGAKTTPHMFVIDKTGRVVYQGAIDDDAAGGNEASARNYVAEALDDVTTGKPVRVAETKPYGCSVKYKK